MITNNINTNESLNISDEELLDASLNYDIYCIRCDEDWEYDSEITCNSTRESINDLRHAFDYDYLIADCELYQEWFDEDRELVFATSICLDGEEVYRYTFAYDSPEDCTIFERDVNLDLVRKHYEEQDI